MSQDAPHVLLVEDDPTLGLLLHDVLRLDGFKYYMTISYKIVY